MCTSKTIVLALFVATLMASCNAATIATPQPPFPAILIFGDSTADTGNNNYHSQAVFKAKHLPYGVDLPGHEANGRFSNGKLISDVIASKLHIKEFVRFYNLTSPTKTLLLESVSHLLVRVMMIVPRSRARRSRSQNNQACSRITLLVSKVS
ncbi:hypothetical protein HID58_062569 [Brassica napus]|uniref:GDSL esterase/lipase n=1 Tax=Brassica napus TaxID=3708 RepID=A0ABQ8A1X7_BRANA|nr:hypothetical protein HID58_062569 [Brassica napus]